MSGMTFPADHFDNIPAYPGRHLLDRFDIRSHTTSCYRVGLMITFKEPLFVVLGVVLSFILLFARYIVVLLTSIGSRSVLANSGILTTMFARGESAAVLTQLVVAAGVLNASVYPDIIMSIIVTSVVISAIGIPIFARKSCQQNADVVQE